MTKRKSPQDYKKPGPKPKDQDKRFWSKVHICEQDKCWEWLGSFSKSGYGKFWTNDKEYRAHRYSWEALFGKILDGLFVCHKCNNTKCVNPNHLFLGTNKDNSEHMVSCERSLKGSKNHQSKLLESDVIEIFRLRNEEKLTHKEISEIFNIDRTNIGKILNKNDWIHIDAENEYSGKIKNNDGSYRQ